MAASSSKRSTFFIASPFFPCFLMDLLLGDNAETASCCGALKVSILSLDPRRGARGLDEGKAAVN
jgi:hypothetical protein